MNAKELVALCSAHGINFVHVAGSASNTDGIAGTRSLRRIEIEAGITEVRETCQGKESRVAKQPEFSQAELGIAAYGVKNLSWCAAQHTIANDRTPFTLKCLHRGLMYHADKYAKQQEWEIVLPGRVERDAKTHRRIPGSKAGTVFYREALCMLVLDEISFKPAFTAAPHLYSIYLGIEQATWEKKLAERFELLQMRYQVWYGTGLRMIQQRITGGYEDEMDERPAA